MNKPLVLEEFGLPRDSSKYRAGTATTARDNFYTALFALVYDSAAAGSPIAGSNFWGWGGEGRSPNSDDLWRSGDPFVCDPPMEKQGLNSVYDTDSATVQAIREHSAAMAGLRVSSAVREESVVSGYELWQNYPNPFNPKTVVSSQLPVTSHVRLVVIDILGREVAVLVNERRRAGTYHDSFDGTGLASGVYICRLTAGSYAQSRKMVLMR